MVTTALLVGFGPGLGLSLGSASIASESSTPVMQAPSALQRDGQHDFDFEFGAWKAHLCRVARPLSRSSIWNEMNGTSVVRKVWDGRANIGEFAVDGPSGHIEGLSLRLYNPQSRQWSIYWANSKDGEMTPPLVGSFHDGRGEFFNRDTFDGRPIEISEITANSFRLEQAFSADDRKTWETNWIATFTR
jgi:hypothetical protein